VQAHAGNGIVVGHIPDEASTVEKAAAVVNPLRKLALDGGGNLVILNCDNDWKVSLKVFGERGEARPVDASIQAGPTSEASGNTRFTEPSDSMWRLMQKLKAELDPRNLLNPGRLID